MSKPTTMTRYYHDHVPVGVSEERFRCSGCGGLHEVRSYFLLLRRRVDGAVGFLPIGCAERVVDDLDDDTWVFLTAAGDRVGNLATPGQFERAEMLLVPELLRRVGVEMKS